MHKPMHGGPPSVHSLIRRFPAPIGVEASGTQLGNMITDFEWIPGCRLRSAPAMIKRVGIASRHM